MDEPLKDDELVDPFDPAAKALVDDEEIDPNVVSIDDLIEEEDEEEEGFGDEDEM
jgi:hypothetical protein